MNRHLTIALASIALMCGVGLSAAELSVANLFDDHAVLQRDLPVPVWGYADPGCFVTVEFAGQMRSATTASDGRWQVVLDPMSGSDDPRELSIRSSKKTITKNDILIGEIWLASGQSNMGFPLNGAHNAAEAISKANDPLLRFFRVPTKTAAEPMPTVQATWELTTPKSAKNYSAVAYFFARDLRQSLGCPIGIVTAPWGGTSIHTWMSMNGLKGDPPLTKYLTQWDKAIVEHQKIVANPQLVDEYQQAWQQWKQEVAPGYELAIKEYNEAKNAGKTVGAKPQPERPEPNNPDPMGMPCPSKRPSTPTVNFNGMIAPLVPFALRGFIWYQGENNGNDGIEYRTLLPRLIDDWRGKWRQQAAVKREEPVFLYVQLPNNGEDAAPVSEKGWPWLREAQLMSLSVPRTGMAITIDVGNPKDVHPSGKEPVGQRLALLARKIAYEQKVVASGPLYQDFTVEPNRIRIRFTETGSGLTIGQSPWYAKGVKPFPTDKNIGFFIAGDNKKWEEADAKIDGNTVIVSSPKVAKPIAVRYGWAASPRCNLYNKEGLPASPFRTDGE